jgi:hypothetical protein
MIPFAVKEPDEGNTHKVFVDGMLMSPGSEDYNLPPAPALVDRLRRYARVPWRPCSGFQRRLSQVAGVPNGSRLKFCSKRCFAAAEG